MATVKFGVFAKRRNSTKVPTTELSDSWTVTLKETTSQDRPTFIVTGNNFNHNYCEWDNKYYFIEDIESLRNNEIAIHCVLDPLATYKTQILASTQFVSYSSVSGGAYLPDTRIPILKDATVSRATTTMNFLFTDGGFYVLTAVGKDGCHTYCADITNLKALINDLSTWKDDIFNDFMLNIQPPATVEAGLENLYTIVARSGAIGNAYRDAPSCIRSCIWVPFFASFFTDTSTRLYLGQYDTGLNLFTCKSTPVTRTATVTIPWQSSGWQRAICEDVYLYLPLVGMVSVPSDEIVKESSISITWSATATDGCIAYQVKAGFQIIGTYGANCSVNYPIGISQQASTGEIVQTAFAGTQRTVSAGISAASSINPIGIAGGVVEAGMSAIDAAYQTANVAATYHNSCIGGIGGGAGTGLSLDCTCFTVYHPPVIAPANMKDTMGLPTMKPMALSTLTGFCQCANAHVEAPATAGELNAIDAMLNSGIYIE